VNLLAITNVTLFPNEGQPTAGIFFANLLLRLRRHLERIVVVTPRAYVPLPLRHLDAFSWQRRVRPRQCWQGIEVYRPTYLSTRPHRHLWFQSRMFLRSAWELCRALHRRFRFDIVLGNGLGVAAHTAQRLADEIGTPSVSWAIGSDVHTAMRLTAENTRLVRHNVRYSDLVLTVCDALRRMIRQTCPHAGNVHVFYRGIGLEGLRTLPDRLAVRKRLGLDPGRTYLLAAGSVVRNKGAREFYEAFRQLAARWGRLCAVWVGDGSEAQTIRRRAGEDHLADRLTITGWRCRREVLDYMVAADLLALPSYAEGLPNVVVEALAARLPVVATDVGGVREVLVDGITGLVVPPRDAPALAGAIGRVLQQPQWAEEMAARGRRFVLEYFDVDRNAAVLFSIFQRLVSGASCEGPIPACAGAAAGCLPMDLAAERLAGKARDA
jgi:glycosyltransferase involved in cell wall biosynthesis